MTRMTGRSARLWPLGGVALLVWMAGPASADPVNVIFTIDASQSTETFSGNDNSYGPIVAASPGSLSTPISGNFIVSFDPTTDTPTSIQIAGSNPNNNNGFYQLANSQASAAPFGTPANLAGNVNGGDLPFALRNLVYNLNSPVLTPASGSGLSQTFTATSTVFNVTAGGIDYQTPTSGGPRSSSYVGATDHLTTGTWTLSESAAGSGQWTLTENSAYTYSYNNGYSSGTLTASAAIVADASYSTANVASVPSGSQTVTVTGNTPGAAVTANLPTASSGGTLTVQQVPGITSLTQAAVTAGQNNPVFALSTGSVSIGAPQIWQVNYSGNLNGGLATLTFDFDPTTIPSGTLLSSLGIWHFNSALDQWQFLTGPIVDSYATLGYDTITIQTSSFSPFDLGAAPAPEPATLTLAAMGLLPLLGRLGRLRRRTGDRRVS